MKKILKFIPIIIIILILCSFLYNYIQDPRFSYDVKEFELKFKNKKNEIDINKFISIKMMPSQVFEVPNNLGNNNHEEMADLGIEVVHLRYKFIITNITNQSIKINFKYFIPSEMRKDLVLDTHDGILQKKGNLLLKPKEKINIEHITIMKDNKDFSEEEKKIFSKYKDILYLEIIINGKRAYIKITS